MGERGGGCYQQASPCYIEETGQLLTCIGDGKAVGGIQVVDVIVQMERFLCEILVRVV